MSIHWIVQLVFLILTYWIIIYPADSATHLLNNRGQKDRTCWTSIQTHSDELNWARRWTFHERNSLSLVRLMKSSTFRGGSRIFFRRGCTRLLPYFNTNKPHSFFFWQNTSCIRKPQIISGGGVRTPCTLPLDRPLVWFTKLHHRGVNILENAVWTLATRNKWECRGRVRVEDWIYSYWLA